MKERVETLETLTLQLRPLSSLSPEDLQLRSISTTQQLLHDITQLHSDWLAGMPGSDWSKEAGWGRTTLEDPP